jgi:dsDNA-specific endonuclease/ATPase MutS2
MTSVDFSEVLKDAKDVSGELTNQARNIDYFISGLEDLLGKVDEEYADLNSQVVALREKLDQGAEERIKEIELKYISLVDEHISLKQENNRLQKEIDTSQSESRVGELEREIQDLKRTNKCLVEEFSMGVR